MKFLFICLTNFKCHVKINYINMKIKKYSENNITILPFGKVIRWLVEAFFFFSPSSGSKRTKNIHYTLWVSLIMNKTYVNVQENTLLSLDYLTYISLGPVSDNARSVSVGFGGLSKLAGKKKDTE